MSENQKEPQKENIYEKFQRIYEDKGLSTNLEALMKFPCNHKLETAKGKIPADFQIRRTKSLEFTEEGEIIAELEITETICSICGKATSYKVKTLMVKNPNKTLDTNSLLSVSK